MGDKIDIHNRQRNYELALEKLKVDTQISPYNKHKILEFIRDCELGKTVKNKSKKKIGPARRTKYITILRKFALWLDVDFDKVTQLKMEEVVSNLENNHIKKQDGKSLSAETIVDYKIAIRKFYKWLLGNNETYPDIVSWMDTYVNVKEVPALTREEIEKLVEYTSDVRNKALIMVLFDSGARIEELLNVRLNDLTLKDSVYFMRIVHSKTKARTISLPLATSYLSKYLEVNKDKKHDEPLFDMKYNNLRMILQRHGIKVLGKSIHPHLLRHSSVTFYCNKLTQYQLCFRYGWSMASKQPARYIDREGINEKQTVKLVQTEDLNTLMDGYKKLKEEDSIVRSEVVELKEENQQLLGRVIGNEKKLNTILDIFKDNPQMFAHLNISSSFLISNLVEDLARNNIIIKKIKEEE